MVARFPFTSGTDEPLMMLMMVGNIGAHRQTEYTKKTNIWNRPITTEKISQSGNEPMAQIWKNQIATKLKRKTFEINECNGQTKVKVVVIE